MRRDIPPHLRKKFRRERLKRLGWTVGIVLSVFLGMSAVARKHYNKAIPWHTAWLGHFGTGGWRFAMKSAIRQGDTYEEVMAKLGPPTFSEFEPSLGQTRMVYERPENAPDTPGQWSNKALVLYVEGGEPEVLVPVAEENAVTGE